MQTISNDMFDIEGPYEKLVVISVKYTAAALGICEFYKGCMEMHVKYDMEVSMIQFKWNNELC